MSVKIQVDMEFWWTCCGFDLKGYVPHKGSLVKDTQCRYQLVEYRYLIPINIIAW